MKKIVFLTITLALSGNYSYAETVRLNIYTVFRRLRKNGTFFPRTYGLVFRTIGHVSQS